MDARKLKKLKAIGGRVTTVQKFLDLSDLDMAVIEIRVALLLADLRTPPPERTHRA